MKNNKQGFFITGTDTGVGKTLITCSLLAAFNQLGYTTIGFKPIASGCFHTSDGLRNDDALALQHYSSINLDYKHINPFAYEEWIAPHIASGRHHAAQNHQKHSEKSKTTVKSLTVTNIMPHYHHLYAQAADVILVEGAGGWHTPLNSSEKLSDLAVAIQLPVVLVVAMRLGCLNHALLTAEAIQNSHLPFAGWIANIMDPEMPALEENICTLDNFIPAPRLTQW